MQVPLLDLNPQIQNLRDEILEGMTRVVDSTQFILGTEVNSLEESIAEYCKTGGAVGVSSGTDALLISLMALGIGPGDKVLTTPYTFFATVGSIMRVGAKPVFADIDPVTMNINPSAMAEVLDRDQREGGRIKALLPVHLFGQCADMQKVKQLSDTYSLPVIEDAAQAIGSEYPFTDNGRTVWKRAGSMGTSGCFSFFPSKNLGGIGDGGIVTTNDGEFEKLLRVFRNHGASPKYYHSYIGGNFRLDPIQACVLNIKLKHLDEWHRARRSNASRYRQLFSESGLLDGRVKLSEAVYEHVPGAEDRNFHIYNQFIIRVQNRDELRNFLHSKEIGCEVYYPLCLHQQKCLAKTDLQGNVYPLAEEAAAETLAIPIYPELSSEQQEYVVNTISRFYDK